MAAEATLRETAHQCHVAMVQKGHWDETQRSEPPKDIEQLVLLGDLLIAVAALADTQRKTGKLSEAPLAAIEDAVRLLRHVGRGQGINPYERVVDGQRAREMALPTHPTVIHVLRQLAHIVIEAGETLAELRRGTDGGWGQPVPWTPGAAFREEFADIGLVYLDLMGGLGDQYVDALYAKQRRNSERAANFGRHESVDVTFPPGTPFKPPGPFVHRHDDVISGEEAIRFGALCIATDPALADSDHAIVFRPADGGPDVTLTNIGIDWPTKESPDRPEIPPGVAYKEAIPLGKNRDGRTVYYLKQMDEFTPPADSKPEGIE